MYFAITCFNRPGSAQLRGKHLPSHLRYLEDQGEKVHTGGPLKDPVDGSMVGSLYIINVASYDEAREFIEGEPLNKAGLFESMMVRSWIQMQPEVTPGANELTAQELERDLIASGSYPFQKGYQMTSFPTQYKGSAGIPLTSDEEILKSVNLNVSRMLAGTGDMSYGFITLVHAIFGTRDIDDKMREIIGLRTAKLLKTPYQWQQHATMGKNAGLKPEEIEAMTIDGPVSGISDDYMLLAQATDELTMDAVLTDACLTSLQRRYGDEVTRKLVLTIAFFNFLSRFLNGCRVPLETTEKMGNRTNPL